MIIVWSNKAKVSYDDIVDELILNWSPDIAEDFTNKTDALLDSLKMHKKLCPVSKFKTLRKCVIHKNVSLIYKLQGNYKINLVTFIKNKVNTKY